MPFSETEYVVVSMELLIWWSWIENTCIKQTTSF